VLGHPSIRHHPNVISREGICLYLSSDGKDIAPMLVFEETQRGNLLEWSKSSEGVEAGFYSKLKACVDVANAIASLHSQGQHLVVEFWLQLDDV